MRIGKGAWKATCPAYNLLVWDNQTETFLKPWEEGITWPQPTHLASARVLVENIVTLHVFLWVLKWGILLDEQMKWKMFFLTNGWESARFSCAGFLSHVSLSSAQFVSCPLPLPDLPSSHSPFKCFFTSFKVFWSCNVLKSTIFSGLGFSDVFYNALPF